jgi:hypothetical protein
MDDQKLTQDAPARRPMRWVMAAAVLLGANVVAAGFGMAATGFVSNWLRPLEPANSSEPAKPRQRLFVDWPKPDLALVISGEMHGYIMPCGCSSPQVGGLERRYNFIQSLKEKGWAVVGVDVGDIAQHRGPLALPNVQGLLKYKLGMESLKEMGYTALAHGEFDASLPLDVALAEYSLNNPVPTVLLGNLKDRDEQFPGEQAAWKVDGPKGGIQLGIAGVVGPSVAEKIKDPKVVFPEGSVAKELPAILRAMRANKVKPDLYVLLYQGTPKEARACAKAFPDFQVILCLGETDEPPGKPEKVGDTLIITIGHKGKYVGIVGINKTGREKPKYELRYQLVALGEEYITPDGSVAKQPVLRKLEEYTRELKRENYLAKYGQVKHPMQLGLDADKMPTYVGSAKCKGCHEHAYEIWEKSPHSHAYEDLVNAKRPSLRQYDGECIVCHTVGFSFVSGFQNEDKTPNLKNVGCESCHGPGSQHAKRPTNVEWQKQLNPWRHAEPNETKRKTQIEIQLCVKCHDPDNDVHWSFDKWTKKRIEHYDEK